MCLCIFFLAIYFESTHQDGRSRKDEMHFRFVHINFCSMGDHASLDSPEISPSEISLSTVSIAGSKKNRTNFFLELNIFCKFFSSGGFDYVPSIRKKARKFLQFSLKTIPPQKTPFSKFQKFTPEVFFASTVSKEPGRGVFDWGNFK